MMPAASGATVPNVCTCAITSSAFVSFELNALVPAHASASSPPPLQLSSAPRPARDYRASVGWPCRRWPDRVPPRRQLHYSG